jgi:hypothetical protein
MGYPPDNFVVKRACDRGLIVWLGKGLCVISIDGENLTFGRGGRVRQNFCYCAMVNQAETMYFVIMIGELGCRS